MFRLEHPNPQWERTAWRNLNGEWEFDFDFSVSAREREVYLSDSPLNQTIQIPFCPESELSGIGYKDFMNGVCYRKVITLSQEEVANRVILHFGAVDFKAYLYVNKQYVGRHIGGYSSFEFDITEFVTEGENVIFLAVEDDTKGIYHYGKQCPDYESRRCSYTRTTGIWQTVWLEFVPQSYLKSAKYYPDLENQTLFISGEAEGSGVVEATAWFDGKQVGYATCKASCGTFRMMLALEELHLWEVGKGGLYDLELKYGEDTVKSYFGMRSVQLDGYQFLINGKSVFQRLVLDQGFYPDGIYTAKDESEFVRDIELSLAAGFNGARLHEKVFEPRCLYHCDKMGYIIWGEEGDWGMEWRNASAEECFINEWMEVVKRDFNHPAIIGWCPHNELWEKPDKDYHDILYRQLETMYNLTKAMDNTRPVIDVSGFCHTTKTDIYDIHDYEQDVAVFSKNIEKFTETGEITFGARLDEMQPYAGEAVFVSEYGGIRICDKEQGWGYGQEAETAEEFIARYKGLTDAMLDCPKLFGFCYTQLYDVEQETNGLYTYQREPKVDMKQIKAINERKAKIEE